MSWPIALTRDEVERDANLVLEGTLLHRYDAFIPGVKPRAFGTHYLFKSKPKQVRADGLGNHIWPLAAEIGFWTYRGFLDAHTGSEVRVSLLLHQNPDGYLTLMPFPCSNFSVVDLRSGESLHSEARFDPAKATALAGHIRDMPFRLETWEPGIFSDDFNPMAARFGQTLPPTTGDVQPAYEIWKRAWPSGNPRVTFRQVINLEPSPTGYYEPAHYRVIFTRIAPYQPGRPAVLANTDTPPPDSAMGPPSWFMRFNQDVTWSPLGSAAGSNQYDFQTVMAHEMGHALGLGHLNSNTANVMYESIALGTRKSLRAPCIDAITNIYG